MAQARASRPVDEEKVKGLITRRVVFRIKMTGEVLKFFGIWSPRNTFEHEDSPDLMVKSGHHPTSQGFFEVSEIFL